MSAHVHDSLSDLRWDFYGAMPSAYGLPPPVLCGAPLQGKQLRCGSGHVSVGERRCSGVGTNPETGIVDDSAATRVWPTLAHRDVRDAFGRWRRQGFARTVGIWALVSAAIAVGLIVATGIVATMSSPGDDYDLAGVSRPAEFSDLRFVVTGNLLVLTLHALACVAAYLARRSLPAEAAHYGGFWRQLNSHIGAAAMWFVAAATAFSFVTQARFLGATAATIADHLHTMPAALLAGLSLHAIPELTAVFLPLAAWMVTGVRQRRWNDLLAATFLSSIVAVPVVAVCALVEVYVSPHIVSAIVG